ncbi:MAG: putative cytokinetic ring protein SteA [Chloroflexi bacterium]|nr:putative cytokinetic ring protein SteA [Chloroflexota bacterium]
MQINGIAKLDKRTKDLVKRLNPGDVAIVDHEDLDRVTAESLVESGVALVVNASPFISGKYPNVGPLILSSAGIYLVDGVGPEIFGMLAEGDVIMVKSGSVFKGGNLVAHGRSLTEVDLERQFTSASANLGDALERFAINTLEYLKKEKALVIDGTNLPEVATVLAGRHALVVVRGYGYKQDLKALRSYIRDVRPALIGVDGGADALLAEGFKPHIIIGDMDSVSDKALRCGAELVVHAYSGGCAPGLNRVRDMGLEAVTFEALGTSEDIAMLLAYEKQAELIVAVGTHANLIEFLDKGRGGMASTFLVRLKVGGRLVDAKGVNKLYRGTVKMSHLVLLVAAAFVAITTIFASSPMIRQTLRLLILRVRMIIGV